MILRILIHIRLRTPQIDQKYITFVRGPFVAWLTRYFIGDPQHNIIRLDVEVTNAHIVELFNHIDQFDPHLYKIAVLDVLPFDLYFFKTLAQPLHHDEPRVRLDFELGAHLVWNESPVDNFRKAPQRTSLNLQQKFNLIIGLLLVLNYLDHYIVNFHVYRERLINHTVASRANIAL